MFASASATSAQEPTRIEAAGLPNLVRVTPGVLSGGLPDGEVGFASLQWLGVKTVISVDGAQPDVELARRHGLRYVHLPHGYDGISLERSAELAKAVRELEGPVYIHCHHGKHRSPAATAVACVGAGLVDAEQARQLLQVAGTSPHYEGLFRSVARAGPIAPERLDALQVQWLEVAPITPLAAAMVEIEQLHDRLQQLAKDQWRPARRREDSAPHQALLLVEQYRELLRIEYPKREPGFVDELRRALAGAESLERELRAGRGEGADRALAGVTRSCQSCHERHRD